jgi:hypothetical protein
MPKKSLYIPDAIDAIIDASEAESYSGRVSYLIALAHMLASGSGAKLSPAEWTAVSMAVDGYVPNYEIGVEAVLRGAWHAVFDHGLSAKKFPGLARKLSEMTLGQQAEVFEQARVMARAANLKAGA